MLNFQLLNATVDAIQQGVELLSPSLMASLSASSFRRWRSISICLPMLRKHASLGQVTNAILVHIAIYGLYVAT